MANRHQRHSNIEVPKVDPPKQVNEDQADCERIYREFEAPSCNSCVGDRPKNTNASYVYAKRGKIRYIKCRYCGRSWSVEGP